MSSSPRILSAIAVALSLLGAGCAAPDAAAPRRTTRRATRPAELREALTFHASFDRGTDADFALGDPWIYHAPALGQRNAARPGLPPGGDVRVLATEGRHGGALQFARASDPVVFYRGADNARWEPRNWGGTVSFWLRADLGRLAPGFCDPLQLTPRAWNDAAFFVEFERRERDAPFRLGAYADFKVWNPGNRKFEDIPAAARPLVTVDGPPFSGERWTHVAFTWEGFNTGQPQGTALLYLDGALIGAIRNRTQTFTWTTADLRLLLGVGYVGALDDVAVFHRALNPDEIQQIRTLPAGIRSLFKR